MEPCDYTSFENFDTAKASDRIFRQKTDQDPFFAIIPSKPKSNTSLAACAEHYILQRNMERIAAARMGAAVIEGMNSVVSSVIVFTTKSLCKTNPTSEKACRLVGNLGKKAGKKFVEMSKKAVTAIGAKDFVKKILSVEAKALPLHLMKIGAPRNIAEQYTQDSLTLALASIPIGAVGKVFKKMANPPVKPKFFSQESSIHTNNNLPYLLNTYDKKLVRKNNAYLEFSHIRKSDGSMTVFY